MTRVRWISSAVLACSAFSVAILAGCGPSKAPPPGPAPQPSIQPGSASWGYRDPDCVTNLASNPDFATSATALRARLMSELKKQNDPRALGQGDVFDQYDSPRTKTAAATPDKKNKKATP